MLTLSELLKFKSLIAALVSRHLAARYRGSLLGFFWSLLTPLTLMVVYTIVFSFIMRAASVEHYELFLMSGLLPWIWTSTSIIEGTSSIVSSGHLITKSMFPAHLLPFVSVAASGINFLLSVAVLIVFSLFLGVTPHATLVLLPVIVLIHYLFLWGISMTLASLNVLYRDVQHLVANAITVIFFLCPIVYTVETIPENYRYIYLQNPFALFISIYQQLFFFGNWPAPLQIVQALCWAGVALVIGVGAYRKTHEQFAEML